MFVLSTGARRPIGRIASFAAAALMLAGTSVLTFSSETAKAGVGNRVQLCHRTHSTTNPYRRITVSKNSSHDNHTGGVFGVTSPWGDIIPSGFPPMNSLNYTNNAAGQAIYNGTTTCKGMSPLDFITSEIAAGESLATILADLDDQGAVEDAATLAALGSSTFTTAFQGQTLSQIQASLGTATPIAVTSAATGVNVSSATVNGTGTTQSASVTVAITFRYGTDAALVGATTVAASPGTASGTTTVSSSATLTGLNAATTYYFQIVLTYTDSGSGATVDYPGAIMTFATPAATSTTTAPTSTTTTTTTEPATTTTTTAPTSTTTTTTEPATTTTTTTPTTTTPTTTTEPTTTTTTTTTPTTTTEPTTTTTTTPTTTTTTTPTTTTEPTTTEPTTAPPTIPGTATASTSTSAPITVAVAPDPSPQATPTTTTIPPTPDTAPAPSSSAVAAASSTSTIPTILGNGPIRQLAPLTPVVVRNPDGEIVLTTSADETGTASLDGLPPGRYLIESTDAEGNTTVRGVEVLGARLDAPTTLALTGSDPRPQIGLGMLLVLLGGALLFGRRGARRPTRTD